MKRFRISTLMLLVVIVALTIALVAERLRSGRLMAQAQVQRVEARMAQVAAVRAQAALAASQAAAPAIDPNLVKAAVRYSQEPAVIVGFAESVVEDLAKEHVTATGEEIAEALVAAAGLPGPADLSEAGAVYVVQRTKLRRSHADAMKAMKDEAKMRRLVEEYRKDVGAAKKGGGGAGLADDQQPR